MVTASLLALLDDIAIVMDDVATLTKVATKKTAGVLGDDLALNAEQVSGVKPRRELPVVWAVAKGSARNKLILVPAALAISALAPWLITPLLMLGGAFLCLEGFEKVHEKLFHREEAEKRHAAHKQAVADPEVDLVAAEKTKIAGAIRTDFILSAEILVISLGAITAESPDADLWVRLGVLTTVSVIMTVGVYGVVAGIVKLDDAGLALRQREGAFAKRVGGLILRGAPLLMKGLGIAGTVAMFLVGGGIITHGIPPLYAAIQSLSEGLGAFGWALPLILDLAAGLLVGGALVGLLSIYRRLRGQTETS